MVFNGKCNNLGGVYLVAQLGNNYWDVIGLYQSSKDVSDWFKH
jgi:hypothetical protein